MRGNGYGAGARWLPPLTALAWGALILNLVLAETAGTGTWALMLLGASWLALTGWAAAAWLWHSAGAIGRGRTRALGAVAAAGAVAVIFGWRGPPAEHLLGVHDEAYNLATAMALLRTGRPSVAAPDPAPPGAWIAGRPTQAQRVDRPGAVDRSRRAYGFLFFDGEDRLRSVFPLGFPVLAAGIGAVFGEPAIFWSNSLFLLGLAAVGGLLTARLAGRLSGLGAGLLLLLCPLHLWISRTAFAEPMLAFVFLCALALLAEAEGSGAKASSARVAVLAATVLPLIKFEGWLAAAAIPGIALARTAGRRERLILAGIGGGGCLLALALLIRGGGGYMLDTLVSLAEVFSGSGRLFTALVSFATAALGAAGWLRLRQRQDEPAKHARQTGERAGKRPAARGIRRICLVTVALGALAFFLWVRPHLSAGDTFYYWPLDREIRSWREHTLERLTWYTSTPGLLLGFFGLACLVTRKGIGAAGAAVATVFLTAFFFLAWDIRNHPAQPYAMRRLVGFATPCLCIGLAVWPLWLPRLRAPRKRVALAGGLLVFSLVFLLLARPLLVENERRSIHRELLRLDRKLAGTGTSPVYLPVSGGHAHRLAIPLQLGMGQPLVPVENRDRLAEALREAVEAGESGSAAGMPRLLAEDAGAMNRRIGEFKLLPESDFRFRETFLRQSPESKPREVVTRRFAIHLLRVGPPQAAEAPTADGPDDRPTAAPGGRSRRRAPDAR